MLWPRCCERFIASTPHSQIGRPQINLEAMVIERLHVILKAIRHPDGDTTTRDRVDPDIGTRLVPISGSLPYPATRDRVDPDATSSH